MEALDEARGTRTCLFIVHAHNDDARVWIEGPDTEPMVWPGARLSHYYASGSLTWNPATGRMALDFGQRAVRQISLPIETSANFSPAATLSGDGIAAFTYSYGLGIVRYSAGERSSNSLAFGDPIVLWSKEEADRRFSGWIHEESYGVIAEPGKSNKVYFTVGDVTKPTVGKYDGSLTLMVDINKPGVASVVGPGEPMVVLDDGGGALATRTLGTGTWEVDIVRDGRKLSLGSFAGVGRGGHDLYVLQNDGYYYDVLKLTSAGFAKISKFYGHIREGGIRPFVVIAASVPD